MKSAEGRIGRTFVIRLEDGDVLPACLESFAAEKGISVGYAVLVGGIGSGKLVVGPKADEKSVVPLTHAIEAPHEVAAVGVLAPDAEGKPILHMHGALGREGLGVAGCLRPGVATWMTGEVVLYEILGTRVSRVRDAKTGFAFLSPEGQPGQPAQAPAPAAEAKPSRVLYLFNTELR